MAIARVKALGWLKKEENEDDKVDFRAIVK